MAHAWQQASPATDRTLRERSPLAIDLGRESLHSVPTADTIREPFAALGLMDLDALPDAVICIDATDIIAGWNRAAETLFGYTAREAVGTHLAIVPPEEEERDDLLRARVMHGDTVGAVEVERYDKAGNRLPLLFSAAPWRVDREIVGVLATFRDLSAQKERECELARQIAREQRRTRDAAFLAAVAEACIAPTDSCVLLQQIAECAAGWADSAGIVRHADGAGELVAYAARTMDGDGPVAALFLAYATGYAGPARPHILLPARGTAGHHNNRAGISFARHRADHGGRRHGCHPLYGRARRHRAAG